jgi:hypothetical protein
MRRAPALHRALVFVAGLAAAGNPRVVPAGEDGPPQKVLLTLERASSERRDGGEILFECRLTLENDTGKALDVLSNFYSAFDGMSLLVRDEKGTLLKEQPYTFHQSPRREAKAFPLPAGKTTERLVFPIHGLPEDRAAFRVQVVGTLPGSGDSSEVSSPVREVRVTKK